MQIEMDWAEFTNYHIPALAVDEIKHGLLLNILAHGIGDRPGEVSSWSLGDAGQCAVKETHWARDEIEETCFSIILGDLQQEQCRRLADLTVDDVYPGVVGTEQTAHCFANRASELGIYFQSVEAQQIYAIHTTPQHPRVNGWACAVMSADKHLIAEWLIDFHKESARFEPMPNYRDLAKIAETDRYMFWIDKGEPVSMAGIIRVANKTAAISGVYTPPEYRGRGYAGAITAVVTERIQKMGLIPTLYTDLQVPASNRCYARIGYRPAYASYHFHR